MNQNYKLKMIIQNFKTLKILMKLSLSLFKLVHELPTTKNFDSDFKRFLEE